MQLDVKMYMSSLPDRFGQMTVKRQVEYALIVNDTNF